MGIINCQEIREEILNEVSEEMNVLEGVPQLAIISIGDDDASKVYVRNKIKTAEQLGIDVIHYQLDKDITQEEAELRIDNACLTNHAVMLQLPIPKHLDSKRLINRIPQCKDVDGLTDLNMGMLVNNDPRAIVPATAMGVYRIISKALGNDLSSVNVVVVNRSQLIGKPLQALLTSHNATVTLCHSRTDNLRDVTSRSHVVVTGVGLPKYFDNSYFSDYQLIADCGMNRDENNKLCGDVNVDDVLEHLDVSVTPTPRGVGLTTTSCLMLSVIHCFKLQMGEVDNNDNKCK